MQSTDLAGGVGVGEAHPPAVDVAHQPELRGRDVARTCTCLACGARWFFRSNSLATRNGRPVKNRNSSSTSKIIPRLHTQEEMTKIAMIGISFPIKTTDAINASISQIRSTRLYSFIRFPPQGQIEQFSFIMAWSPVHLAPGQAFL